MKISGKGFVSEWLSRDLLDEVIGAVRKHIISRGSDRQTSFQVNQRADVYIIT